MLERGKALISGDIDMIDKISHFESGSNPLTSVISSIKQAVTRRVKTRAANDDCPYFPEDGNSENIRAIGFR